MGHHVGLLVAVDPNWVIGVDGQLPWHYSADLKRFKALTMNTTVIMGHKTWESLPKPLPGRRCVVVSGKEPESRHPLTACNWEKSFRDALFLTVCDPQVWIIGGASIYQQALESDHVHFVDLTLVPPAAYGATQQVTYFPKTLLEEKFHLIHEEPSTEDPRLAHRRYERSHA